MNSKEESFMLPGIIAKRTFNNAVQVSEDRLGCTLYKSGHLHIGKINLQGKPMGTGILFFPFCGFILSEFQEEKCHGLSLLKFPNNDFMITNFINGVQNGKCYIFDWLKKETIILEFKDGKIVEEVEKRRNILNEENYPEVFHNIKSIEQSFINLFEDKKQLNIVADKKSWSIGTFSKGKLDGIGLKFSSDFKLQTGHFTKGELNGHGRTIDLNGDVKVGIFHKGQPERDVLIYNNKKNTWFSFDRFSKRLISIQSNIGGCFPMPSFNISSFPYFLDSKVKKFNKNMSENFFTLNEATIQKETFFNFKQNFRKEITNLGFEHFIFNYLYPISNRIIEIKAPMINSCRSTDNALKAPSSSTLQSIYTGSKNIKSSKLTDNSLSDKYLKSLFHKKLTKKHIGVTSAIRGSVPYFPKKESENSALLSESKLRFTLNEGKRTIKQSILDEKNNFIESLETNSFAGLNKSMSNNKDNDLVYGLVRANSLDTFKKFMQVEDLNKGVSTKKQNKFLEEDKENYQYFGFPHVSYKYDEYANNNYKVESKSGLFFRLSQTINSYYLFNNL